MKNKTAVWSDGVLAACKYLGLPELPQDVPIANDSERRPLPSDFLGNNFELDQRMVDSLKKSCRLSDELYDKIFTRFRNKYNSQKIFESNSTDMDIFFVDYLLIARKDGYNIDDYFDFEFYYKSVSERKTFLGQHYRSQMYFNFNHFCSIKHLNNKAISNITDFIHRDWLDLARCSFDEFKIFTSKHPTFLSKVIIGDGGRGVKLVKIDQNFDLPKFFSDGQRNKLIVEEIIRQHAALAEFCPDTLNTIRINTLIDKHGTVRIMTAAGRFGRVGNYVDNFHSGGYSVIIDPVTGIVISDGLNRAHQRAAHHPDTGKTFRGFQYPCWNKVRATAISLAKIVPSLRYIGWDIAIDANGETEFVEGNETPGSDIQQAADSVGRLHLYKSFLDEYKKYQASHIKEVGYRINNLNNFKRSYKMVEGNDYRRDKRISFAVANLIVGCKSLLDVGCRESKAVKTHCPTEIEYHAVDYEKYDEEVIECDFNAGSFPDLVVDTCLSIYTAEYVELLPEFLDNLCRAARRQVLMVCRPIDKEIHESYRFYNPFTVDFTEEFLINSINRNGFYLYQLKTYPDNRSVILYDFRRG